MSDIIIIAPVSYAKSPDFALTMYKVFDFYYIDFGQAAKAVRPITTSQTIYNRIKCILCYAKSPDFALTMYKVSDFYYPERPPWSGG